MSEQSNKDTGKDSRLAPTNEPLLEEIEAKPFWADLREHRLTCQRCSKCAKFRFPPQAFCPACLASEFEWVPVSGKGKVYSHVTYHRAWHPAYQEKVPYNVSLIDLEEGIRMMSNVVDCKPDEVYVNMAVEVVYEDLADYTLPKFRPANKNS